VSDLADGRRDGLRVRGGSGGTTVGLDSLDRAAGTLSDVAQDVAVVAGLVAAGSADPDVVASALLSPATAAVATEAMLEVAGPVGLGREVAALLALSASVRAAATAYRAAESGASAAVERAQDAALFVAGRMAPQLLVGVLALDALGADVAGGLDRLVFADPEVADLAGGAEGLVLGLRSNPLTAPLVLVPPRPDGGARQVGADGRDTDYEDAVHTLADSAAVWGLLDDRGRAEVVPEPAPRAGASAPRTLQDLAAAQRNLDDGEGYPGHVRVIEVPQPRGSVWVVEISGTQAWDPRAGATPFDLTTDVRSMAQDATVLAEGVQQALAQAQSVAGHPAGADTGPVMLVGHSLGGIAAAGLAASPRFRAEHQVTHVVTMGAPVGRMPVPAQIQVLSLEHTRDPVPRLEGQRNPDRATWVTVTRDTADTSGPDGERVERASQSHDVRGYVDTAALVDRSTDASVATWRSTSATFFAGDAYGEPVIRDYLIRRVRP
jgi:hypothetical protein